METIKNLTDLLALIGAVLAALKFFSDKRKERSKAGNEVLEQLETDEQLILACRMLDWTARTLEMPKDLVGTAFAGKTEFTHTHERMAEALSSKTRYSWEEVAYRDCFDHFFTFLTRVNAALNSGVYEPRDVLPLKYYVDLCLHENKDGTSDKKSINVFLKAFGYYEPINSLYERLSKADVPRWELWVCALKEGCRKFVTPKDNR